MSELLEGWEEDERTTLAPIREETGMPENWFTGEAEDMPDMEIIFNYIRALETHVVASKRVMRLVGRTLRVDR